MSSSPRARRNPALGPVGRLRRSPPRTVAVPRRDTDVHVGTESARRRRRAGPRRSRRSPGGRSRRSGGRRCWCGTRAGSPGSHHGSVAASAAVIRPQSHRSSLVSGSRMAGTPARWHSAWRSVAASLPPAANSGHTVAIGVVERDQAVVDELEREERQEGLAHRVEVDQGVEPPGPSSLPVPPPAGQVHHDRAVDDHVHRRTDLAPLGEVPHELLLHAQRIGRRKSRTPGHPRRDSLVPTTDPASTRACGPASGSEGRSVPGRLLSRCNAHCRRIHQIRRVPPASCYPILRSRPIPKGERGSAVGDRARRRARAGRPRARVRRSLPREGEATLLDVPYPAGVPRAHRRGALRPRLLRGHADGTAPSSPSWP